MKKRKPLSKQELEARNPILRASLMAEVAKKQEAIMSDGIKKLEAIRTEASIHALVGGDYRYALASIGRILFIAYTAAISQGMPETRPQLKIIAGAASAAGDVNSIPATLDQHRQSMAIGLKMVDDLWPELQKEALLDAFVMMETMLLTTKGLNLSDFGVKI